MNKIIFWISSVFLIYLLGCGETGLDRRKKHFLHKGNLSFKEKMYRDAIRFYLEAIELDSSFAQAYNNLGIVYAKMEKFPAAVQAFSKCLKEDPVFIEAYFNRGNANYEVGNFEEALIDLNIIKSRYEPRGAIQFLKGLSFFGLKDYDSAEFSFSQALLLDSGNIENYLNLATTKFYLKRYDASIKLVDKALQIDVRSADAYNLLGMISAEKSNYHRAVEYYNEGLEIKSNHAFMLNNRGYAYLELNEFDKSLRDINESIVIDPDNAWAYRNKGIYYYRKGKLPDAERLLLQSINMDESLELARFYLGKVYIDRLENDKACHEFMISSSLGNSLAKEAFDQFCL